MRVLALDVGSSSVRAGAYDEDARPLGEPARREYASSHGQLDADELLAAAEAVLAEVGESDAVGSSCFWHSLLLLDEHERPLTPVLTWQDRRAVAQAEQLAARLDPSAVHERTGAPLHPSFWPAKLAWLREQGTLEGARRAVSFAEYVFLRVTGELRMSLSSASGTGLLNLRERTWDVELLDELALDAALLPPISDEPAGTTYPPLGDGACSNLGAGCVTPDRAALNIGTSGALRILRDGEPEPRGGLFSYLLDERRVVEGGAVSDGGNFRAWAERTLQVKDVEPREPDGHGLTFLPLLGGERSPGWDPHASGAVAGLTFDHDAADLLQAGLEGIAYRIGEIGDRLPGVREVVATGQGLLESEWWMQVFADVLGLPLVASAVAEGSARGAAVYALERLGVETGAAPLGKTFEPDPERGEIYAAARDRQRDLYDRLFTR
ncbi:MAG TPA: gluconokinase [Gaiellaceae bacterium]|nr:gluconokinase [Gaiellaceae bacterium]